MQNFFFGIAQLELQGLEDFQHFIEVGALFGAGEPSHLHGESAGAADDAACSDVLVKSADQGDGAEPEVVVEVAVFKVEHGGFERGWNGLLGAGAQTPLLALVEKGAQQVAVFVHHQGAVVGVEERPGGRKKKQQGQTARQESQTYFSTGDHPRDCHWATISEAVVQCLYSLGRGAVKGAGQNLGVDCIFRSALLHGDLDDNFVQVCRRDHGHVGILWEKDGKGTRPGFQPGIGCVLEQLDIALRVVRI